MLIGFVNLSFCLKPFCQPFLSHMGKGFIHTQNGAVNSMSWAIVMNLFTTVNYEWAYEALVFASGKPIQLSIMFASKARRYPRGST